MGGSSSKNDFSNQIGTGSLPPGSEELEIDADMTHLDLRLKRLTTLPWDLSVLTNLRELDLSMNLYTQLPEQCVWRDGHLATSLTKLSINQNRIQMLPEEIQEMTALQTLCIYDNIMTSLPKSIHRLNNLTQLSIYNNFITELPEEFCRIPKLQFAFLSNNRLTSLPNGLEQLTCLRGFYLDGNPITELPGGFYKMPKIEDLTLCNCSLRHIPEGLSQLTTLKELYLNGACGNKPVRRDNIPESIIKMGVLKDCYDGQI
mmetsp:Transcript_5843/g.20624  ORF Transcript_5843/g.20624 Transcript_5843/m.20624 type:complete len:259 (-) Transcript_5843:3455-4231(-)